MANNNSEQKTAPLTTTRNNLLNYNQQPNPNNGTANQQSPLPNQVIFRTKKYRPPTNNTTSNSNSSPIIQQQQPQVPQQRISPLSSRQPISITNNANNSSTNSQQTGVQLHHNFNQPSPSSSPSSSSSSSSSSASESAINTSSLPSVQERIEAFQRRERPQQSNPNTTPYSGNTRTAAAVLFQHHMNRFTPSSPTSSSPTATTNSANSGLENCFIII